MKVYELIEILRFSPTEAEVIIQTSPKSLKIARLVIIARPSQTDVVMGDYQIERRELTAPLAPPRPKVTLSKILGIDGMTKRIATQAVEDYKKSLPTLTRPRPKPRSHSAKAK